MKLLIVRHAKAEERNSHQWPDDSERPLSSKGTQQFKKAARVLGELLSPDLVFASPYVRAVQTAEILEAEAKWPAAVLESQIAAGDFFDLIDAQFHHNTELAVIVGHEPSLSELISELVRGDQSAAIRMRPGAAALLKLSSPRSGELQWLMPPQVFI